MKYLDIEILCNRICDRFSVNVKVKRIHKDAKYVTLRLDEKVRGQCFNIERNWDGHTRLYIQDVRLPDITEQNGNILIDISGEAGVSNDCTFSRHNVYTFFYRILMALYYWDKRCSRSVNVKGKLKEDMPMKIIWDEKEFNLSLEQMLQFAEYIKQ